jgi:hypothetical protein
LTRLLALTAVLFVAWPCHASDIDSLLLSRNNTENFIKGAHALDTVLFTLCDSLGQRAYKTKSLSAVSAVLLTELGYKVIVVGLVSTTDMGARDFKERIKSLDTYWFWDCLGTGSIRKDRTSPDGLCIYCCFNLLRTVRFAPRNDLITRDLHEDHSSGVDCRSGQTEYVVKLIKSDPEIAYAYVLAPRDKSVRAIISELEDLMDKHKLDMSHKTPKLTPITQVSDF